MKPYHTAWLKAHPHRSTAWLAQRLVDGFDIHHLDGDHRNESPDNLVLIEHTDHMMLHCGKRHIGRLAKSDLVPRERRRWVDVADGRRVLILEGEHKRMVARRVGEGVGDVEEWRLTGDVPEILTRPYDGLPRLACDIPRAEGDPEQKDERRWGALRDGTRIVLRDWEHVAGVQKRWDEGVGPIDGWRLGVCAERGATGHYQGLPYKTGYLGKRFTKEGVMKRVYRGVRKAA